MGHTPEQRDRHNLCGARKKNGEDCRAFAGQGTDHPGYGRCKFHLGNTPNQRKQAVALEAAREMVTMGRPIDGLQPHQALLALLRATAGHAAWCHAQITELDDVTVHDAQVLVRMYDSERDRLTRIGEACLRSGISEEEVRIREAEIAVLATCLANAAAAAGLDAKQRRALGRALREELQNFEAEEHDDDNPFVAAA